MTRILAIAKNTFRETIRDRILFAVAGFAVVGIFFSLFLGSISLEQDERIIKDVGLLMIFLLQVFITIFVGANLIFKEIERKTFFLLLPKPVTCSEIIAGKYFGMSMTNLLMTALTTIIFFGVVLIKTQNASDMPYLLYAVALGYIEVTVLTLASIMFSALTSPILSSIYTALIFVIGHAMTLVLQMIQQHQGSVLKWILYVLYYVFPNFEKFNIRNGALYHDVPSAYGFLLIILYAAAYSIFLFAIALAIFRKREF